MNESYAENPNAEQSSVSIERRRIVVQASCLRLGGRLEPLEACAVSRLEISLPSSFVIGH
jgi:hypothetical protein